MENFAERLRRAEGGEYYTPSQTDEFLSMFGKPKTHKHKKREYVDLICAFDTETTSFNVNGVSLGTMYVWMFGVNGAVMIGRTWEQFKQFCNRIVQVFKISPTRNIIVYVHNLAFDFQFFRKHFEWEEVFARSERTPMYARTVEGIEFRCSYILTNSSLATVGKNLIRVPVEKKTGDLDYSIIRTWATPLTDEKEIQYCINDVLVIMSLIYDRRIAEKNNIARIPLTQTGYARRECRSECLYKDRKHWKYLELMRDLILSKQEYIIAKLAFAGGFTHASPYHVGEIGHSLSSYDFTSSYPAVIVAEKFPMGRGVEIDPTTIKSREQLAQLCLTYCCIMVLEFDEISATTEQDYYISESRCIAVGADAFNGRIASAEKLTISLTDIDWEIIQHSYKWKHFKIQSLWRYRKAYLPSPYVRTVLALYKRKTELKGVAGQEEEYARAKELLNSLYGMMATQIDKPEITYTADQEWQPEEVNLDEVLDKYNTDTRRFISYLWGCYVTAYARRNLWSAIFAIGGDYWYSDTDSVKVSNADKYKDYFDRYNAWIIDRLKKACDYHKISYDYICPKTIKGKEKPLGVWDYEGNMPRFKTLGAKRYLYTTQEGDQEELHITCAGVAKKPAIEYLWYKYKNMDAIFNAFEEGICFPGVYYKDGVRKTATGKSTHLYCDNEFDCDLTDYLGYTAPIHELSCINLSEADYNLGIAGAFKDFLKAYWEGKVVTKLNT